eukprot:gene12578-13867_t
MNSGSCIQLRQFCENGRRFKWKRNAAKKFIVVNKQLFQSYIFSTETPGEAELPKEASSFTDFRRFYRKQQPASNKPRCTRNSTGALRDPIVMEWTNKIVNEGEIAQVSKEQQLQSRVEQLTTEIHKLTIEFENKEKQLQEQVGRLQQVVNDNKFSIDRFKHNQAQFKFYTGFDLYVLFKPVLDFLEPAASSLNYWGSSTNTENKTDPSSLKQGEPATSDC